MITYVVNIFFQHGTFPGRSCVSIHVSLFINTKFEICAVKVVLDELDRESTASSQICRTDTYLHH